MKTKFTYLWMVVMTMMLSLGFTACSDDDEPAGASASIMGEWEELNEDDSSTLFVTFGSGLRGQIEYTVYNDRGEVDNSITQHFEYDYIEADRSLTIINSLLEGEYRVTLTATTLRLVELDYRGNETGLYYQLVRR